MIGTDSHTPNAGGLGMVAIGVGGADAVDVMTGFPFNVRWPKVIGVQAHRHPVAAGRRRRTSSSRSPGCSPSRAAPARSSSTSARAPTASRPPARPPSATWAPRSAPPAACSRYDHNMAMYLKATGREAIADAADKVADRPAPRRRRAVRPAHRDRPRPAEAAHQRPALPRPRQPRRRRGRRRGRANGWPLEISSALIGSCTNSSYEDITRAASIARQAAARGLQAKTELLVTPGSEQTRATIERDGLIADLEAIGATVLANACGPCIGQWDRPASITGQPEHHRQLVQPQLPEAQRRLGQHAQLRHLARHRHRPGARRSARLRPDDRHASPPPTAPRCSSSRRSARCCPTAATTRARTRSPPPPADGSRRRRRGLPHQRPAAAAAAVPGVGRQRLPRPAGADEGQGQVHHRPHLGGRQVAHLPRPPREHLRQPVPRRGQRVQRRRRRGQGRPRRQRRHVPEPRQEVRRGRHPLGAPSATATTARARRASTPRWSPGSAAAWSSSPAASPASTRPT